MRFLNILDNLRARTGAPPHEAIASNAASNEADVLAMLETLYSQMLRVLNDLPQLQQEDFDLEAVKTQLLLPVAHYLTEPANSGFLKPLFVTGVPGIGKTTLLMILDEVLSHLNRSCRDLVGSGKITGYFADKSPLAITPLSLFGEPTAVLSTRDWNNILRHWTFDETVAGATDASLNDFLSRLQGKVVIMDEAELEGYVYISELLGQHNILVILSSNLAQPQIHLPPEHVRVINLYGSDHRYGDISKVCLPAGPHPLFDPFAADFSAKPARYITKVSSDGVKAVYFNWHYLEKQPLMKDDFARLFVESGAEAVLLDAVPFFEDMSAESISLTFLGHLARFVNFVDAIHDSRLPLLIRGTQPKALDAQTAGSELHPILTGYDKRTGSHYGEAAWIEWTRCLSRLRSREAFNAQVWQPEATTVRN